MGLRLERPPGWRRSLLALCLMAGGLSPLLTACHDEKTVMPSPEALAARRPADDRLAALYEVSCKACHANPESGAPAVAVPAVWRDRWTKGMPTLLEHALAGFNGMPAGGQCFSCTPDDYRALIRFLAGQEAPAAPSTSPAPSPR